MNGDVKNALCFLVQPEGAQTGDVVEYHLVSHKPFCSHNKAMIATMSALVVDSGSMTIRANASGKARRLEAVLDQFDCTWDLGFIAKDLLVQMLPKEFKEFRRSEVGSAQELAC